MKTAEELRAEMDAEGARPRDWEAEGSLGWQTVVEFGQRMQLEALEAAADAVQTVIESADEQLGLGLASVQDACVEAIRRLKPST